MMAMKPQSRQQRHAVDVVFLGHDKQTLHSRDEGSQLPALFDTSDTSASGLAAPRTESCNEDVEDNFADFIFETVMGGFLFFFLGS